MALKYGNSRPSNVILAWIFCLFLSHCGGDGPDVAANEGLTSSTETGHKLRIALTRASDGSATTQISSTEPGVIVATFKDGGDRPIVSSLVTFSSTIGVIQPATTALTDSNGQARVQIAPAGSAGAGTLTARTTIQTSESESPISASVNFFVADAGSTDPIPDDEVTIELELTAAGQVASAIRVDAPGRIFASVRDSDGNPESATVVSFSGSNVTFNPPNGTALTNAEGVASIDVLAGNVTGVASVSARVGDETDPTTETLNFLIDPPAVRLGSGSSETFSSGALMLTTTTLSAGGTTGVTATVVDSDDQLFDSPLTINFTSRCVAEEKASIDTQVATVGGVATATYRADGCVGSDVITASLNFGGTLFTATATLDVSSDAIGSLRFVDAVPSTIVLKGAGGQGLLESSQVSFRVLGEQGNPLANQTVDFSLTTSVGGITLTPTSAVSDSSGLVTTTVQSGSVATSVVVLATLAAESISTQSGLLVISTGVPDQDSLTISAANVSPEAWLYNGEEVSVTAFAADQFNNPVPDGVRLSFTTEGGLIESSCTTDNGACSVTLVSQNPRPANGRVTLMVTAVGSESFSDENGNGVFDDGDLLFKDNNGNGVYDTPTGVDDDILYDLGEAFRDDNFNGAREPSELYFDFNTNGVYDGPDGLYGGPLCLHSTACAGTGVTVRDQLEIVFAGSHAVIGFDPIPFTPNSTLSIRVADGRDNSMPSGTTVSIETSEGQIPGATEFIIENTIRPAQFNVFVEIDEALPAPTPSSVTESGVITVTVTTPKGTVTTASQVFTFDVEG